MTILSLHTFGDYETTPSVRVPPLCGWVFVGVWVCGGSSPRRDYMGL